MRQDKLRTTGTIFHKRHQCLAYADDIAFMTRTIKELQNFFRRLQKTEQQTKLRINEEKTMVMSVKHGSQEQCTMLETTTVSGKMYKFKVFRGKSG